MFQKFKLTQLQNNAIWKLKLIIELKVYKYNLEFIIP